MLAGMSQPRSYVSNLERGQKRYNVGHARSLCEGGYRLSLFEPWELIGRNPLADDERQGADDCRHMGPHTGQKSARSLTAARVLKSFAPIATRLEIAYLYC